MTHIDTVSLYGQACHRMSVRVAFNVDPTWVAYDNT